MDNPLLKTIEAELNPVTRFSVVWAVAAGMAFALGIYDWIVLSQREYRVIVKAKWRWANIPYIVCRICVVIIVSFAMAMTFSGPSTFCDHIAAAFFITVSVATLAGGIIFLLRLMALWNWNIPILVGMSSLLMAASGYGMYAALKLVSLGQNPLGGPVCVVTKEDKHFALLYVLDGSYDLLVLILTVVGMKRKNVLGQGRTRELLLRPTVRYYGIVSIWYWVTAGLVLGGSGLVAIFFVVFVTIINPVIACRVFLRTREAGLEQSNPGQTILATHRFDNYTVGQTQMPDQTATQFANPSVCCSCARSPDVADRASTVEGSITEKAGTSTSSTPNSALVPLPVLTTTKEESAEEETLARA